MPRVGSCRMLREGRRPTTADPDLATYELHPFVIQERHPILDRVRHSHLVLPDEEVNEIGPHIVTEAVGDVVRAVTLGEDSPSAIKHRCESCSGRRSRARFSSTYAEAMMK